MTIINVNQAADIRAVLGASGTGKSHYTKAEINRAKRCLIWDMEDEYDGVTRLRLAELPTVLHRLAGKPFRYRFVASTDAATRQAEFDLFCRVAMAVGNMLVVVEELRFVTQPSKAPAGWAGVVLRGRKRGLKVIGTSQRPASIDKDFLSNATHVRCGAMGYPEDRAAVSKVIGGNVKQIEDLQGFDYLFWARTPRKLTAHKVKA